MNHHLSLILRIAIKNWKPQSQSKHSSSLPSSSFLIWSGFCEGRLLSLHVFCFHGCGSGRLLIVRSVRVCSARTRHDCDKWNTIRCEDQTGQVLLLFTPPAVTRFQLAMNSADSRQLGNLLFCLVLCIHRNCRWSILFTCSKNSETNLCNTEDHSAWASVWDKGKECRQKCQNKIK